MHKTILIEAKRSHKSGSSVKITKYSNLTKLKALASVFPKKKEERLS